MFHQRFFPVIHRFRYPLFLYCLDLSELDDLGRTIPGFAYNHRGLRSIHDSDYLNTGDGSIRNKLDTYLHQAGCAADIHRVMLITSPRFVFSVFNPVSFYYCFQRDNELACVVAEVNNTFGERHLYIVTPDMAVDSSGRRFVLPKVFHVSPFNSVEGDYEFYFGALEKGIDISITMRVKGEKKFIARFWGDHSELTWKHNVVTCFRHPMMPHLTMIRILKEAGMLYFKKKLPYVPKPVDNDPMTIGKSPSNSIQKVCMRLFVQVLKRIETGYLTVTFPNGDIRHYGDPSHGLKADLTILDYDMFPKAVIGGDIGFGEAYMDGLFRSSDIRDLIGIFIALFSGKRRPSRITALFSGFMARLISAGEKNTLQGSKKNIRRHYDLSNDFFRQFLDDSMMYSCAAFESDTTTLEQAQQDKLLHIIQKADIRSHHHVLEIGSGWGAFAIAAVQMTGCRVTTITLSNEQHHHVSQKIHQLGLEDRIDVKIIDYRSMAGQFDRIVSIEMLEAVGHQYLGRFFNCCDRLLKPGGLVFIQVITLPDQEYAAYRLRLDWIQKHIFPGGHLPSLTAMCNAMTDSSSLIVEYVENIGPHYATTLNHWHQRFSNNLATVRSLGYDEIFIRKWEYYLKSCEAMFLHRALEDLQLVLVRPYERRC